MHLAHSLTWFRWRSMLAPALLAVLAAVGCQSLNPWSSPARQGDEAKPSNSMVKDDKKVIPAGAKQAVRAGEEIDPNMQAAEDLYRLEDYKKAEKLFHKVAENTKNPPLVAEKARFFEAECQKQQDDLANAMGTYNRMLMDFAFGIYREQAVGRMYDIAKYWLEDTWKQLDAERERDEGKRWFVTSNFFHTDKTKPTFDEEGHAISMLEQVYYNDPTGPYADKALFLVGYVNFWRGNFRIADQFLSQLVQMEDRDGKRTPLRDQAIEMAILAKTNSSGGAVYDGRKNAEALKLIQQARATSPKLATEKADFLDRQIVMIRYQQAEKDFQLAQYYRRTGRPASAWFYYELVRRRYQGTEFYELAMANMKELQSELHEAQDTSFAAMSKRIWAEKMLGHQTPKVSDGKEIPKVPGELPESTNPILPAGATSDLKSLDLLPKQ